MARPGAAATTRLSQQVPLRVPLLGVALQRLQLTTRMSTPAERVAPVLRELLEESASEPAAPAVRGWDGPADESVAPVSAQALGELGGPAPRLEPTRACTTVAAMRRRKMRRKKAVTKEMAVAVKTRVDWRTTRREMTRRRRRRATAMMFQSSCLGRPRRVRAAAVRPAPSPEPSVCMRQREETMRRWAAPPPLPRSSTTSAPRRLLLWTPMRAAVPPPPSSSTLLQAASASG